MRIFIIALLLSGCSNLDVVNRKINAHQYVTGKYDCQNFVEDKYRELIKSGYKDDNIKFVLTSYKTVPHVVLRVNGLILDNNFNNPYPATKALQGGMSPEYWFKVKSFKNALKNI